MYCPDVRTCNSLAGVAHADNVLVAPATETSTMVFDPDGPSYTVTVWGWYTQWYVSPAGSYSQTLSMDVRTSRFRTGPAAFCTDGALHAICGEPLVIDPTMLADMVND